MSWPPVPALIAHRGASASFPEHTLAAYRQAIQEGADVIEPDLVITRDGVLVARHDNVLARLDAQGRLLEATTNVHELAEFAARCCSKTIDGIDMRGWFVEDFTLAELKTLRARERLPHLRPASAQHNDAFDIPTFDDIITLAKHHALRMPGRAIGVEPETKHPSYFHGIGLPLEPALLAVLQQHGWNHRDAPVVVQSFEVSNLKALRKCSDLRLAQLVDLQGGPADGQAQGLSYAHMQTSQGLADIAAYADVVAPHKEWVRPWRRDAQGQALDVLAPTALVQNAHALGLGVQVWTLRPENFFLPAVFQVSEGADDAQHGHTHREVTAYLDAGVDALFCDDTASARAAIDAWLA